MKARELMRRFKEAGWTLDRVTGSHHIFKKCGHTFPVPMHAGKDLSFSLVQAALKKIEQVG